MKSNSIPTVRPIENIKNLKSLIKNSLLTFLRYHEKYGDTFILKDNKGKEDIWMTTDPGLIQHIFQKITEIMSSRRYKK